MTRRSLLATAAGTLAAAAKPASAQKPNVLFYFPDQVRACEMGYNGGQNIATPHIDRLASQGVTFRNGISTCPLCTPYRAMLQTGRWPSLSGGVMNWINLPSTGQSMGDVFSRGGYDTGYIGKWHLAAGKFAGSLSRDVEPPERPEPEFVPPGPARMGYQYWAAYNFQSDWMHALYYRDTPERLIMPRYETDSETDMAIDFMRARAKGSKPFFLTVAPHPPHPPWSPKQTLAEDLARVSKDLYWRPNVKDRNPSKNSRCYYGMIGTSDNNLGRMMKFLDESGLAENTIVVFSTDHGEMMASHGRYDKMVPYVEATDIPLIIRWPKHLKPAKSDMLYTPMDHLPTLASLCGLKIPGIVNGKDLSANLLGRSRSEPDAALMMNFTSHWDYAETGTTWPEWRAVRTKQYTYVKWLAGSEELYDNAADPYQMKNLMEGGNPPAIAAKLRARLKDLLHDAHDEFLPGTAYGEWLTIDRNFKHTAS
jgi:arylsulfatase A-like enzyme